MAISIVANQPNKSILPVVKLYPDLSASAFRTKQTTTLALWHCLRSLPTVKGGNITADSLNDIGKQLEAYGYKVNTAVNRLIEANGLFWRVCQQKGRTVIKIYGLLAVCKALSIDKFTMDRHARLVNAGNFNSCQKRNSHLYASIFKPKGVKANPITRETITSLTGLEITQQRRYEKLTGITRTANFEVEETPAGMKPVLKEVYGKSKTYVVSRRLGNIYHTLQETGCKGQTCKVSRLLKVNKASLITDETLPLKKVFFTSLKRIVSYFKGNKGTRQAFYLVRNKDRRIKRRMEWCFNQETPLPLFKGVNYEF